MLEQLLTFIPVIFVLFIPIVIWAYMFSYIEGTVRIQRLRFISGIIAGGVSLLPIVALGSIFSDGELNAINVFEKVYFLGNIVSYTEFLIALISVVGCLFLVSLWPKYKQIFTYTKEVFFREKYIPLTFVVYICIFVVFFALISLLEAVFPVLGQPTDAEIIFGGLAFSSVKLVVFYYLLVAFIEETSKYFQFLSQNTERDIRKGIITAIYVALGFAFLENIIYTIQYLSQQSESGGVFGIILFRSIFSTLLHVTSTVCLAYGFLKIFEQNKKTIAASIGSFIIGIAIAVGYHTFFNVSLNFGFTFIVILSLVFGYLYVGGILTSDSSTLESR